MLSLLNKWYERFRKKRRQKYIENLVHNGLKLGQNVEIIDTFFFDPSHCFLITIGDNCTICPNVRLIAHDASSKKLLGFTKIGPIVIGDNCFLGDSVIVLADVKIGDNCIVGAGSVVTHDIPENCVAAGNPARILCSTQEYRKKIALIAKNKTIFSTGYYIDRLTDGKREEILESVKDSIGFIV